MFSILFEMKATEKHKVTVLSLHFTNASHQLHHSFVHGGTINFSQLLLSFKTLAYIPKIFFKVQATTVNYCFIFTH